MSDTTYFRGRPPHLDSPDAAVFLTFRLADAVPPDLGEDLTDTQLDRGFGGCALRDPRVALLVRDALLYFHGERYELSAYVVMPNHVHVVVLPLAGYLVSQIVHSWKSFTAKEANRILGSAGAFWQRDYFDRALRTDREVEVAISYTHGNPVKAGLVCDSGEWPWSSAAGGIPPICEVQSRVAGGSEGERLRPGRRGAWEKERRLWG